MIPPEKKSRIVLSILAGEVSIAEAARKEKVSEQSIGRWKAEFIEAGKSALAAGKTGPSTREAQLEAEVDDLTRALGEAAVEIRVWKKSAEGRLGPSRTSPRGGTPRGSPRQRGDADREVHPAGRHPGTDVPAVAGQGQGWASAERTVAGAGPRRAPGGRDVAGWAASGMGTSEGVGHGPPRRTPALPVDRSSGARRGRPAPVRVLPAGTTSTRRSPQGRVRGASDRAEHGVAVRLQRVRDHHRRNLASRRRRGLLVEVRVRVALVADGEQARRDRGRRAGAGRGRAAAPGRAVAHRVPDRPRHRRDRPDHPGHRQRRPVPFVRFRVLHHQATRAASRPHPREVAGPKRRARARSSR